MLGELPARQSMAQQVSKQPLQVFPGSSWQSGHCFRLGVSMTVICRALTLACRSKGSRTVAVIPETAGTELWEAAHAGVEAAGVETGFHVYWNAPTREDDVERQIALAEQVIEDERAGLVLAPTQHLALVGPVREALSKRIPTVIIRSPLSIPPGQGLSYSLNDEYEMGRIAAMRIGTLLKGKGRVAILGLDPNISGILSRSHASRGYFQSSPVGLRPGARNLPLEGLRPRRQARSDDAGCHRVLAPLLSARAA